MEIFKNLKISIFFNHLLILSAVVEPFTACQSNNVV